MEGDKKDWIRSRSNMATSIFFMTNGSSVQRNSNRAGLVAEQS